MNNNNRFCTTGLPSDIVVEVGEMSFHLHKVISFFLSFHVRGKSVLSSFIMCSLSLMFACLYLTFKII